MLRRNVRRRRGLVESPHEQEISTMRRTLRLAIVHADDVPLSPAAIASSVEKLEELTAAEAKAAALHAEREQNLARAAQLEQFLDDPVERRDAGREFRQLITRRRVLE